ncbi:putative AC transposase [Purpureocillium lavendulum]|uniref:AC transposase n=1 Tax=Purpureocillium lavendulum TaxID=1247861 RepID=A0AB34FBV4_9HYPO|nr:putative AC transposase [Purpureocillium lavendulum]
MSSVWSDNASTVSGDTIRSTDGQIVAMSKAIEMERGSKELAIIGVVGPDNVNYLETKSEKRWWQFWKGKSLVIVTAPDCLQDAIREVCDDSRRRSLIIMASIEVTHISFSIRSRIQHLEILRCCHEQDPDGYLLVRGKSKFHGIRMDEWQEAGRQRKRNKVYLSRGVHVQIDADLASTWSGSSDNLSYSQRQSIQEYLRGMNDTDMTCDWWQRWKGMVSGIVGVAVTSTKLGAAMHASAGGLFINLKYAGAVLQAGGFGAKLSGVMTAAGPAVLFGAAAAACVYFVPWGDVLTWLQDSFMSLWQWFTSLFGKLMDWIRSHPGARGARRGRMRS